MPAHTVTITPTLTLTGPLTVTASLSAYTDRPGTGVTTVIAVPTITSPPIGYYQRDASKVVEVALVHPPIRFRKATLVGKVYLPSPNSEVGPIGETGE